MCSCLRSRTTRKECNISWLHHMLLISEVEKEQALLMNVVGLRRRWRHKFWKVMMVSSACWRKRVCRWILIGCRAYLSICCVWKFGQEVRKGVHIVWPNCCLSKFTQSAVIHSRHSNCKMPGFAAVYLRSVIFWHVVKSQWEVCYWHFGTACWSHFQALRCPRRMLVNVCDKPDDVALCVILRRYVDVLIWGLFAGTLSIKDGTDFLS